MSRNWLAISCVILGIGFTGSLFAQGQKVQRIPFMKDGLSDQVRQGDLKKDVGGPVPASATATDVLVNNNAGFTPTSQFIQSESDVIAFGNTVIVVFNDAGSFASGSHFTGWSRSTDGGATFVDGGLLPTSTVGDAGDPVIARNNTTGRLYFSTLGFNSPGNIQMFRSDDNGATWGAPVNATPGGTSMDKQWHTVDNFAGTGNGNVYMIARDFAAGSGVFLWHSTNNGDTWGTSTLIVSGNQGAYVAVGTDHAVYAFWYTTGSIQVRKSTDFGVTFSPAVTVASGLIGGVNGDLGLVGIRQGTSTASGFRSNEFPHAAVNPVTGNIYVTYDNKGAGADKGDIFLVQSIDGGATWSAPVKINDDVTTTDQWQPTVAVTPAGNKIGIFYYSRQEDPTGNNLFKFYGRLGNLSGGSISFPAPSFAISDVASLPEFGRDAVVNSVYMSDYQHAYATPTAFHVAWSDNRDDLPGGAPRKDPNMYYEQILTTDNFGWAKGTITNVSGGAALSGVTVDFVQTPNAPSISDPTGFYKAGVQVDTPAVTRIVTLRASKFGFRDTSLTVTVIRNDTITRNFAMTPAAGGTLSVYSHTATTNLRSFVEVKFGTLVVISDSTNGTTGLLTAPLPAGTYSVRVDARSPYVTRIFPSVVIGSGTTNVDALTQPVVTNNPAAMRDTLAVGQVHAKTLTLTNTTLTDTVTYRLSDDNALARVKFSKPAVQPNKVLIPEVVRPKGSPDPAPGQTDSSGGPDVFGYRWIDSDSPGGPVFNWFNIDTVGRGTAITFPSTDDGNTTVPMTLPIPFYGNTYSTSVNVCTNGWISFTSTSTAYSNTGIPDPAEPNNAIYGFWDDLNVTSGSVKYYYDAPNTRFIVQYTNVPYFSGTGTVTFQIILYPNGQMIVQYLSITGANNSATVGIENAAGTVALQVANSSTYIHNNLALKFFLPDAPWLSEAPSFGRINPNSSLGITCTFDANGLTLGTTYSANIIMDITHPDVTGSQLIPASLRVIPGIGPVISANPTSLTFPTTIIGNIRRDSIRVRNVGSGTPNLLLSSVTTTNARYAVTTTSTSIAPGDSARIRVTYTPVVPAGTDTGRVIILSNDPANPRVDVMLNGTSVGSHFFRTYIDSLVKNMSGALLDSTRFFIRNAGTAAGNFSAQAVMIPRTLDGQEGKPIVIPMKVSQTIPINYPNDPIQPSVGFAPVGNSPVKSSPNQEKQTATIPVDGDNLLVANGYGNDYRSFQWTRYDPLVPGTLTGLGPIVSADAIYAGDFTMDGTRFIAIKGATNQLIEINVANGSYTVIGPVTVDAGHTWTSAKFDPTSGTFYATSTNITVSSLYTINITNGTTTRVTTITNMPAIIGMAMQPGTGQMYGYDIVSDNFFSIDKTTGVGTLIGPIGFNANLAQDMAFDRSTGVLYMAAYNGGLAIGESRTVNLTTGATTLIGQIGVGDHLIDPFSIQGSYGPSTAWLSVAPTSGGPVAVNDSTRLTAYFDTRSPGVYNLPGNYFGRVEITNPGAPAPDTLKIPVRMFLQPAAGADLVVSPDTIDVGNVEIGRTDSAKSVLVRNIGASTLTVTNVTFTGTGASSFSASRTSFTLNSLDTLRIKVRFAATAPGGVRTARMNFTCNDPTPQSVGLRAVSVGVAHVTVRPDTFYFSRGATPDTTFSSFKIFSTGTDSLRYTINESNTSPFDEARAIERSKTQQRVLSLGKGVIDPTPGEGGTDGQGGPDAFGYRWIDSDEPGGPTYNWTDITGVGTAISFSSPDDGTASVALPFTFRFYGINYTNLNVCTNGHMSFVTTSTEYVNTAIPVTTTPNGAVYGFWDDLNFTGGGTAHSYYDAANQRFIIQFTNVPYFSGTGTVTFQMIVYANGTIRTQYNSVTTGVNNSCTIGIENETGTVGLQVVFNASYLHDNLAILFTSDIITWMSTDRTSGTVAPGDSQAVSLRIHPAGLAGGLYTGFQKVRGNTPDTTANVRVRLNVIPSLNTITVTSPNGGENWIIGQTYPITWTKTGAVDTVRIEYSTAGSGGPWNLITAGVPAKVGTQKHPKFTARFIEGGEWDNPNGTFNWLVPNTPSTNCYVRVLWKSNNTVNDLSNGAFTIGTGVSVDTTWVTQTSGTTLNLYAVKALDYNTAWAGGGTGAGTSGIVLRTTNGGTNWLSAGTFPGDVYTITAVDGNIAIAANYTSTYTRLVRTANGGATWATVDSIPLGFYDYVHMFNATNGYAMGDPVGGNWVLKRTTNGGLTWTPVTPVLPGPAPEAGWNNSMQWLDANTGWFGTNNTKIYRTTNGGTSWTGSATTFVNSYSVGFAALTTGLTGSDTGPFNKSTDGGATWAAGPAALPAADLGMWANPGSQEFWVASGNNINYSSNFGTSWSTAPKNGRVGTALATHVNMVKQGTNIYGWAVGYAGTVARYRRILTGAGENANLIPAEFALSQNYPNPFNPTTKIKYDLPEQATVVLKIYNLLGQEVATLANNEQAAGYYEAVWDGRNNFGAPVSSGVYFYRFEATSASGQTFANLKKMIFLK